MLLRRRPAPAELPGRRARRTSDDEQFVLRNHLDVPYDLGWIGSPDWVRFDAHAFARGYEIRYASWHPDQHGQTRIRVTLRRAHDDVLNVVDLTGPDGIASPARVWQYIAEEFAKLDKQLREAEHRGGPYVYTVSAVDEHGERIPGVTLTFADVDEDQALRVMWSGTYIGPQPDTNVVIPWK
jgi:hypothetical protein